MVMDLEQGLWSLPTLNSSWYYSILQKCRYLGKGKETTYICLPILSRNSIEIMTEVPEEITPQQCGEWEQVYHHMGVINECLDVRQCRGTRWQVNRWRGPPLPGVCLPQKLRNTRSLKPPGRENECGRWDGKLWRKCSLEDCLPVAKLCLPISSLPLPLTCIKAPFAHPWSCRQIGSAEFIFRQNLVALWAWGTTRAD